MLQDPEWGEWSNYKIAEACRVNEKTVRNIRLSLTTDIRSEGSTRTYKTNQGAVAKMKTSNIGGKFPTSIKQKQDRNRRTEREDHPLNSCQSATITQLPSPDSASVELNTGERDLKPTVAHHLKLSEGELVEVYAPGNNKIDSRRGRIASLAERTVEVWLRDTDIMVMQKHTLKHQQVKSLPLEKEPQLKQVCDRLTKLREHGLDPFEVEILNLLERTVVLTPTELEYLAHIEQRYGITQGGYYKGYKSASE